MFKKIEMDGGAAENEELLNVDFQIILHLRNLSSSKVKHSYMHYTGKKILILK